ncbi:hypothetical protein ACFL6M_01630 [Candidatus Eisenbacteria bacterium]|uniref:Uncharacterized protein n=1 Tax=Eiseniibacteriota bacterium TaxID=2212470 RepID=A0ABV6YIV7_UNCEI
MTEAPGDQGRAVGHAVGHTTAHTVPVLSLGPWLLRPTSILRKQRKRRLQVLLLYPPPGFSGDVRLDVIGGDRREEFMAAWVDGHLSSIPDGLHADLGMFFSHEFSQNIASQLTSEDLGRSDSTRWPTVVAAALDMEDASPLAEIDLLLEATGTDATGRQVESSLTGSISFARAEEGATVYLAPILAPSSAQDAGTDKKENASGSVLDDPECETVLDAALHGMGRNRSLRFALPDSCIPALADRPALKRLRVLTAAGRLEVLRTGWDDVGTAGYPRMPLPTRTGLMSVEEFSRRLSVGADDDSASSVPGASPSPSPSPRRPRAALLLPPDSWNQAPGTPPPGRSGWARFPTGRMPFHSMEPFPALNPLSATLSSCAAILFDRVLATTAARMVLRNQTARDARGAPAAGRAAKTTRWGFLPFLLADNKDWKALGGHVRSWNRQHASPNLRPSTPSDFFALLEELYMHRAIQSQRT